MSTIQCCMVTHNNVHVQILKARINLAESYGRLLINYENHKNCTRQRFPTIWYDIVLELGAALQLDTITLRLVVISLIYFGGN